MSEQELDLFEKEFLLHIQHKSIETLLRHLKKFHKEDKHNAYNNCWIELVVRLERFTGEDFTELLGD